MNGNKGRGWRTYRRTVTKLGSLAAISGLAGCSNLFTGRATDSISNPTSENQGEKPGMRAERIKTATRTSTRDFHEENYEIVHTYRRTEALRTLLRDPKVNSIAREWSGSFEAYEPLTNALEAISIQGSPEYTVNGGFEAGKWDVTAKRRQTIYGLVDRRFNELVALQITDPIDVSWTETYDESILERGRVVVEHPDVSGYLQDKEWWMLEKVGESITSGEGLAHGDVTIVIIPVIDDGSLSTVSAFVDVTGENPKYVDSYIVKKNVRYPIQDLAREVRPVESSALDKVPKVPREKRPLKTAAKGFHHYELPEKSFTRADWQVEWEPPETQGVTFSGSFRGQPVFAAMNSPTTFTAYDLPPREGRSTLDWFFPDRKPVINGHHLFWDIHSVDFGGPGGLGKIDYPARGHHPPGFQFRTHFHTGAQGKESVDFHSGVRFGPYNYNIEYEFFGDGRLVPIWRRHGPGYITESLYTYGQPDGYQGEENVIQQYISAQAFDMTPGTETGVEVQYFDGDSWQSPAEEFYHTGEPGEKLRFTNPDGPQTIDIPLNRGLEAVVVKRKPDEIGPAASQATRAKDMEVEVEYYHPAQYVDGDSIQNERVIFWLLMEGSTDEVPHASGVTGYVAQAELQLQGY